MQHNRRTSAQYSRGGSNTVSRPNTASSSGSTSSLDLYHSRHQSFIQDPHSHRTLYTQTRLSRPPTSGPSSSQHPARSHPSSRSMPGEFSNFFGNVKRSLSLNLNNNKRHEAQSNATTYYGITPEEDAARFHHLSQQRPLMPPPTIQQIASGVAVTSSRPAAKSRSALAPPPSRSSLKRISTTSSSGNSAVSGIPPPSSSKLFSVSSPSLALSKSSSRISNVHTSTSASSTASSITNSTASSSFAPRLPFARKHKLSLSISTITGRRGSQTTGRSSPTDSGLSWGIGDDGSTSGHSSTRKAVRFSESDERSHLGRNSGAKPVPLTGHQEVDLTSPSADALPPSIRPSTGGHAHPHHPLGNTFVGKTARFFSGNRTSA